jgi:hypothetical protein
VEKFVAVGKPQQSAAQQQQQQGMPLQHMVSFGDQVRSMHLACFAQQHLNPWVG